MKIGGKSLVKRATSTVSIVRGEDIYELTITSLPLGWHDTVTSQRLVPPVPPETFVKDESGRIVKSANKMIQTKPDYNDPGYRAKANLWQLRYNALAVCDLLRDDEQVTWDANPPDKNATREQWEAFADELVKELDKNGFTDTDLEMILGRGQEISASVDIDGAMKRFLSNQDSTTEPVEA